jgi:hypothetical protein
MLFAIVERLAHNLIHRICAKLCKGAMRCRGQPGAESAEFAEAAEFAGLRHRLLHAYNHGQPMVLIASIMIVNSNRSAFCSPFFKLQAGLSGYC